MKDSNGKYSVITGDVVKSSEHPGYGEVLDDVFRLFEKHYEDYLPLQVDRFAGDTFQLLLSKPSLSLEASLYLFTRLASADASVPVRLSIGYGEIGGIPEERVSIGEGEAFRISGSNLESMEKYQRITFDATNGLLMGSTQKELMKGTLDLLSALMMDLTRAQAEVIWYKLRGYTQVEIAEATDRSQQTVSEISIAGHWRNLESLLSVFEKLFVGPDCTGE
jgi:hypothetical protein